MWLSADLWLCFCLSKLLQNWLYIYVTQVLSLLRHTLWVTSNDDCDAKRSASNQQADICQTHLLCSCLPNLFPSFPLPSNYRREIRPTNKRKKSHLIVMTETWNGRMEKPFARVQKCWCPCVSLLLTDDWHSFVRSKGRYEVNAALAISCCVRCCPLTTVLIW